MIVPGVHAYAAHSVLAGETLRFHVSSTEAYTFSWVQLGKDPHTTSEDIVLFSEPGVRQPTAIHPGSYVHIESLRNTRLTSGSVSGWIRPFRTNGAPQALISQRRDDLPGGWAVFLDAGRLTLDYGPRGERGRLSTDADLVGNRAWNHFVATFSPERRTLWLNGRQVAESTEPLDWDPSETPSATIPVRLGASGVGEVAALFLDADIAHMGLHRELLGADEVAALFEDRGHGSVSTVDWIARWTFREEQGETIGDGSGNGHTGVLVNGGTWMIGGPDFDARTVDRFDRDYNPGKDPQRGHGLRLSSEDLRDCGWPILHEFSVPLDAVPGFYCGRFEYELDGQTLQHNVTVVVRRHRERSPPPILVLAAVNTWRAYNWFPFAANLPPGRHDWGQSSVARRNPNHPYPTHCFYRDHAGGQPTYVVGLNLPCESADPYRTYRGHDLWGQWVVNERLVHLWLDRHGYAFDVATDMDLDKEDSLLEGYKTLFVVGHSEYWSDNAYRAVEQFLGNGGTVVVLSANTMFWRVDLDTPGMLGCRKLGSGMLGSKWTSAGEIYHGHELARGGLMRFSSRPAWKLIGLETAGWGVGMDFLPYTRTHTHHRLFEFPHPLNISAGDLFGYFHGIGIVGHEYDVRPSILVAATPTMPPGYEEVADPPGITVLAQCFSDRKIIDYWAVENMASENPTRVLSEVILWDRPDGGRVFNIGSVAAPWGLYYDEAVDRLVRNVLHAFGVNPRS